jgi:hypothetical protein
MGKEEPKGKVDPQEEVDRIIRTAKTLGVEVDETDVSQWLTAMAAADASEGDVVIDEEAGVFGHEITLLDFDRGTLDRYRHMADIVQLPDKPNVETAISLSGSAAQGVIQLYPGDADFFERVNIIADTREESVRVLGELMREKALAFMEGPEYQLNDVRFGTWQEDVIREGERVASGSSMMWRPDEIKAGKMEVLRSDGEPWTVEWEYAHLDPGWCKMDWLITEKERGRVVNASNMLDVTWETPEGEIVPLDGFLDPYFQEVYLEAESVPVFSKLAEHISPKAQGEYVHQLTGEVYRYAVKKPNYGKVAKRMYNIFRLTGRTQAAALIRELFDEPAALLYQVGSLIDTIGEAADEGTTLDRRTMVKQLDKLVESTTMVLEGPEEAAIVAAILKLRDDVTGWEDLGDEWHTVVDESKHAVFDLVNEFFQAKLMAIQEVADFLEELEKEEH